MKYATHSPMGIKEARDRVLSCFNHNNIGMKVRLIMLVREVAREGFNAAVAEVNNGDQIDHQSIENRLVRIENMIAMMACAIRDKNI